MTVVDGRQVSTAGTTLGSAGLARAALRGDDDVVRPLRCSLRWHFRWIHWIRPSAEVDLRLYRELDAGARQAVAEAADRYGAFLGTSARVAYATV